MVKINLKMGIIFTLMLFLMIGVASASENATADNVISEQANPEVISDENVEDAGDVQNTDEDAPTAEKSLDRPQIEVSTQNGYEGKTLTLKATVKKENGSVNPVNVHFKFNGKTYDATTDSNGVASVILKFPKSKVLKTTSKTKGKVLTNTTYYKATYRCEVTADGDDYNNTGTASFDVISTKDPTVKKYQIIKKKKTYTIKVKKGANGYKKGDYGIVTWKYHKGYYTHVETGILHKSGKTIKFLIKHHTKKKGKWKWDKWSKVPVDYTNDFYYGSAIKLDKIKVRYTQITYKRI